MTKKIVSTCVVIGTMFMVIGCGAVDDLVDKYAPDEDDNSVLTGTSYYIDSAVSGVNYTCGSQEGITGADGSFTFEYGSGCTFYLGDMELRSVDAGLLMAGESVVETNVEIARVLQSLDSDGNPDNGITIDAEIVTAMAEAGITTLPNTTEELAVFEEVLLANDLTLVSTDEAQSHLDETVSELLLAGKTFYVVGQNVVNDVTDIWGGEATFNADLTEMTYIEAYGPDAGVIEIEPISIDGNRLVFENDTDGTVTIIGENKGDYIELTDYHSDGTIDSHIRFYFDKIKADAYVATLGGSTTIPPAVTPPPVTPPPTPTEMFTTEMLTSNTFYTIDYDNGTYVAYVKSTLNATTITRHEIRIHIDATTTDHTFFLPYTIINGVIKVDLTSTNEGYLWISLISSEPETTWIVNYEDDFEMDGADGTSTYSDLWDLSLPDSFPTNL